MNEREKIMGRIREALTVKAPRPGAHGVDAPHQDGAGMRPPEEARKWLPAVGSTFEERVELFRKNSVELKTDFQMFADQTGMVEALKRLAKAEGWRRVASHGGSLTGAAVPGLGLPELWTDKGYDVHEMEKCDAGISECDALVAQTGSVLVTTRSAGGRALSVLPPHHLVLARRGQMLPDLTSAFELVKTKYAPDYPSFISLITGPSRTGDIERILVLGAHGPKKLTIFCF